MELYNYGELEEGSEATKDLRGSERIMFNSLQDSYSVQHKQVR